MFPVTPFLIVGTGQHHAQMAQLSCIVAHMTTKRGVFDGEVAIRRSSANMTVGINGSAELQLVGAQQIVPALAFQLPTHAHSNGLPFHLSNGDGCEQLFQLSCKLLKVIEPFLWLPIGRFNPLRHPNLCIIERCIGARHNCTDIAGLFASALSIYLESGTEVWGHANDNIPREVVSSKRSDESVNGNIDWLEIGKTIVSRMLVQAANRPSSGFEIGVATALEFVLPKVSDSRKGRWPQWTV